MASNLSSEYKVVADKIVSPDEDIIIKVRGALYKDSIEEANRYATIGEVGEGGTGIAGPTGPTGPQGEVGPTGPAGEGSAADIADFIFTEEEGDDVPYSSITLPGDKEMRISAGADSDLYLYAGDDLYVTANDDDVHIRASDDIRFISNFDAEEEYIWRMNSDGTFEVPGRILSQSETALFVESISSPVVLSGDGGEFLNNTNPEDQIATIGDVGIETEFVVSGGSLGTQPTFNGAPLFTGSYVKTGPMVHFRIDVDFDNITSFGTGQYYLDLPIPAKHNYEFTAGCLHDISATRDYPMTGHIYAGESRMLLKSLDASGNSAFAVPFTATSPVTLAVADNFHISGDYIADFS